MAEDGKSNLLKDKAITVKSVLLEQSKEDVTRIAKIRFETNIGDITWKPKLNETKFMSINGVNVPTRSIVDMKYDNVPAKITDIVKKIQEKGDIKMKVDYMKFDTTDAENHAVSYRFINSEKLLERWTFIEEETLKADGKVPEEQI